MVQRREQSIFRETRPLGLKRPSGHLPRYIPSLLVHEVLVTRATSPGVAQTLTKIRKETSAGIYRPAKGGEVKEGTLKRKMYHSIKSLGEWQFVGSLSVYVAFHSPTR